MFDTPSASETEVSLLGTGGGYGESVVVHVGNGKWIIVDSCVNPNTKKSLPKEFLLKKGVNLQEDVVLIVCSHWHDDHVRGLSELLGECSNAKFCMAETTDPKKFLLLLGLDAAKAKKEPVSASYTEMKKCIDILNQRDQPITTACQDRLIYKISEYELDVQVFSLSPSDLVIGEFKSELSNLIKDFGSTDRKIVNRTPNEKCVVLLVKINGQGILLGADMEISDDERRGWKCIVKQCLCIDLKSSLYKIPHHGSENGHDESIWENLLSEELTAKLSPWNRGSGLPKKSMLNKLLTKTEELYITSSVGVSRSPKKRSRDINKAIVQLNPTVVEQKFYFGIVQSRLDHSNKSHGWQTSLFESALQVNAEFLAKLA